MSVNQRCDRGAATEVEDDGGEASKDEDGGACQLARPLGEVDAGAGLMCQARYSGSA